MINGSPQENTSGDIEELQLTLDQPLQSENYRNALAQSLHDAARVFELAIRGEICVSNLSWFSITWLGVDQNAWLKALSYQASVCSLLIAACEISSSRDRRDEDINVFVKKVCHDSILPWKA